MNNTLSFNFQRTFSYLNQTPPSGLDIDDCNPNPCENGGTCTEWVNDYTCDCIEGWQGENCEIPGNNEFLLVYE